MALMEGDFSVFHPGESLDLLPSFSCLPAPSLFSGWKNHLMRGSESRVDLCYFTCPLPFLGFLRLKSGFLYSGNPGNQKAKNGLELQLPCTPNFGLDWPSET